MPYTAEERAQFEAEARAIGGTRTTPAGLITDLNAETRERKKQDIVKALDTTIDLFHSSKITTFGIADAAYGPLIAEVFRRVLEGNLVAP
jgi:hypothetical protein